MRRQHHPWLACTMRATALLLSWALLFEGLLLPLGRARAQQAPEENVAQTPEDDPRAARRAEKRRNKAERARGKRRAQEAAAAEAGEIAGPGQAPPAPAPAPGGAPQPTPTTPSGPTAPVKPEIGGPAPEPGIPELPPFETGIDYEPQPASTKVTFNLENADLNDLVRMISQVTGKRFILPGKGRSISATVYAPTKVTVAEAYQAFLSILELNGMSIVPAGRYLKIVESGRIEGRPIPLYDEGSGVPSGDRFITRIHPVEHISAEDAAQLLERFKSGDGSLTAYAPTNVLIITDTGTNLQRMIRILGSIDIERTGEQIWVEPVHHADATEIAATLSEIFDISASGSTSTAPAPTTRRQRRREAAATTDAKTPAPTPGSSTVGASSDDSHITKVIADERTNSLIILATESAYLRILEMLRQLDVPLEGEGRIHVHHLQHSDAEEIASTLSSLVSGRGATAAKGKTAAAPDATESIFEGGVAITAHKASNALVITSSPHDYAALRSVIAKLDTERKQVFIEAVIMELGVDRSSSFGTSWHGGIPNFPVDDSVAVTGFQAANTIGGLQGMAASGEVLSGLAVGVQGPVISNSQQLVGLSLPAFGVAINALATSGDANILSTPHLIATDNVEAEISVGQNVPLQTSASLGSLGGLSSLAGLSGSQTQSTNALAALGGLSGLGAMGGAVPRQDVGTTITLTPHINETDEIRLEISEEISSAGAPSQSGDLGVVSIDRTQAKTDLVVRDQQTVVIGGLMRDQLTTADTKVPVLGDIPLLGILFRSTSQRKVKKNLLLFLTPYIVRSPADLRSIYDRKMRERQEFLDRYFVFGDARYEPPVDYSRTRGLVGEMMNEIRALDEQRQLIADAAAQPEKTHDPRPPVGDAPTGGGGSDEGVDGGDAAAASPDAPPPPPPATSEPAAAPAPED